MKLYFLYSVVSNKTVRQNENFYKKFKKNNKAVLGQLVQTNRGYFIDGHHVDWKSAHLWMALNEDAEAAKDASKPWKEHLKKLKEKENETNKS